MHGGPTSEISVDTHPWRYLTTQASSSFDHAPLKMSDAQAPRGEPGDYSMSSQSNNGIAGLEAHRKPPVQDYDARLRALLDQQAQIQAEIKSLLPQKYALDIGRERTMLSHKHKMLKSLQEELGLVPVILSEEEECRSLQYKCECLEATCLQSGKVMSVSELLERSSLPLKSIQPSGFSEWLETNATKYDPILRTRRSVTTTQEAAPVSSSSSFKCPVPKCVHYIYGFPSPEGLESHKQLEHLDNASLCNTSFLPTTEATKNSIQSQPSTRPNNYHNPTQNHATILQQSWNLPEERQSSSISGPYQWEIPQFPLPPHLLGEFFGPPKNTEHAARDRRPPNTATSNKSYSFVPELTSVDFMFGNSETFGSNSPHQSHSIQLSAGSLGTSLNKEVGPCLRCKILKKKCDAGDPCSLCPEQDNSAESDYWKVLGCHRGSLASFAEILVPTRYCRLNPNPDPSPESNFVQAWWEYLQSKRSTLPLADLRDEFGIFGGKEGQLTDPKSLLPFDKFEGVLPPSYTLLRTSSKLDTTVAGYDLLELFRFSARISGSKEVEYEKHPLLSFSKRFLREAFVFEISHDALKYQYGRYGRLYSSAKDFLLAFDDMTLRRGSWDPRSWLAAFCSLCFFHATVCFLSDGFTSARNEFIWPESDYIAIHCVYKALVSTFAWSTPSLLDDEDISLRPEEDVLFSRLKQIIFKDKWVSYDIASTKDFLMGLGSGFFRDGFFHGFVQEDHPVQPTQNSMPRSSILNGGSSRSDMSSGLRQSATNELITADILDPDLGDPIPIDGTRSSAATSTFTSKYQKPRHERLYCRLCNDNPEGYRGEHELRRHHDRSHSSTIKKWICVEPQESGNHPRPETPLSKCKACVRLKSYGAYYNAAAHLRRTHFKPKHGKNRSIGSRAGRTGGDWPPMSELKFWMKEIEVSASEPQQDEEEDSRSGTGALMDVVHPAVEELTSSTDYLPTTFPAAPSQPYSSPQIPGFGPYQLPPLETVKKRCPYFECGKLCLDLAAHMLTHQNERPEKCPVATCDYHYKGFARKHDRDRHVLTHYTGTLVCPFCPGVDTPSAKTFSRADVLKRHLMSAHGVDPLPSSMRSSTRPAEQREKKGKCSICRKEYEGPQEFYEHLDDCVLAVIAPAALPRSGVEAERAREHEKGMGNETTSEQEVGNGNATAGGSMGEVEMVGA